MPNLTRQASAAMSAAVAIPGQLEHLRNLMDYALGVGNKFFVSSLTGASTNDGKSSSTPVATIAQAVAKCQSAKGDRIYVMPGHSETVTTPIVVNLNNIAIIGMGEPGECVVTTTTADINLMDITGNGVLIENLMFTNTGTLTTQTEMIDVDASYVTIRNCIFSFAATDKAEGINLATGYTLNRVIGCKFILPDAGESCILWASSNTEIAYCDFDLSAGEGVAIAQLATPGNGIRIHDNVFAADGTVTPMISWEAAPGAGGAVYNNRVFDCDGDVDVFGDDTDLDTWFSGNFHGSTAGAEVAINPSVS